MNYNFVNTLSKQNYVNLPKLIDKNSIFNPLMNYYICSFGGCGSTVLHNYLSNFGNVYHIHDRFPPHKLQYVGDDNSLNNNYKEWFNGVEISDDQLCNYKVIYIYRNPLYAIHSRFFNANGPNYTHLQHIKCINNGYIGIQDLKIHNTDLFQLEEFFDNYTIPNKNRNYKIYCVKYEQFWDNISFFNQKIGIPNVVELYPKKQERKHNIHYYKFLHQIYIKLNIKMANKHFIELI
jgi:hypothetical protein